jgi:hypothetical protein
VPRASLRGAFVFVAATCGFVAFGEEITVFVAAAVTCADAALSADAR